MRSFIFYWLYNLVFQIAIIGFLFYANTYLNEFLIPDFLRWRNGELREDLTGLAFSQATVLVIEAAILLLIIYYVNKWYLSTAAGLDEPGRIALRTASIYSVITVGVILVMTYLNFQ